MTKKAPSAKAQEQALLQKLLHGPVFARLPTPDLQLMLRAAKPKAVAERAAAWKRGEASKGLCILLKGQLKIIAEDTYDHPIQPIAAASLVLPPGLGRAWRVSYRRTAGSRFRRPAAAGPDASRCCSCRGPRCCFSTPIWGAGRWAI